MTRFEKAKRLRPLGLAGIAIGIIGFVLFETWITLTAMVIMAPAGFSLVCQKCRKIYLGDPFDFLFSGKGDGKCNHCGTQN